MTGILTGAQSKVGGKHQKSRASKRPGEYVYQQANEPLTRRDIDKG